MNIRSIARAARTAMAFGMAVPAIGHDTLLPPAHALAPSHRSRAAGRRVR